MEETEKTSRSYSNRVALKFGWSTFKQYSGFLILVALVTFLVRYIIQVILNSSEHPAIIAIFVIVNIAVVILIKLGWTTISLNLARGVEGKWKDFIINAKKWGTLLLSSILYFLIVLGGLILLIVPGLYWSVKFGFFPFIIVDNEKVGPWEALKKSAEITEGNRWKLLGFKIILWLINLLGFVLFFVGLLATTPTTFVAWAHAYNTLKTGKSTSPKSDPEDSSASSN